MKKLSIVVSIVVFWMVSYLNAAVHEMFPQEVARGGMALAPQATAPDTSALRSRIIPLTQTRVLPIVADQAAYPFFTDVAYTTTVTRVSRGFGNAEIVEGKMSDAGIKSLSIYTPGGVRHEVRGAENGFVYVASSRPDGTIEIQEFDPKAEPGCCGNDKVGGLGFTVPLLYDDDDVLVQQATTYSIMAAGDTEVDLMMVFDTEAAAWAQGNAGGVIAFANSAVSRMNTALSDSGIACVIRLVGTYLPNYTSDADFNESLTALQQGSGNLSGVEARRTACGADVVSMMIDVSSDTAGLGYVNSSASYAFTVCAVRSVNVGHTMTHEIGHNFGCGHSHTQPGGSSSPYAYGAGLHFVGSDAKRYHTIMAYYTDGAYHDYEPCVLFSSPNLIWKDVPAGNAASADNARVIRERMATIAAFRAPTLNNVTVTFDAQSGAVSPASFDYIHDTTYDYLPFPYRTGYTFDGWYTGANGSGTQITTSSTVSSSVIMLYAKWLNGWNDNFASAATLSGMSGSAVGANVGATQEAGEPNPNLGSSGYTVWWRWTAPANGVYVIDTLGSSFDTILAVYTGGAVSSLAEIAKNDNSGGVTSSLEFTAVAGTVYAFMVDGKNSSGTITLNWKTVPLRIDSTGDFFSNEGSSKTVSVVAFGAWSVSKSVETTWITYATGSGNGSASFQFTVEPNTTGVYRAATLVFTDGVVMKTFEILQNSQSWITAKTDALSAATTAGKKVLLVAGRFTCPNTRYMRTVVCEQSDVKAALKAGYVLWYCDVDYYSNDYWVYTSGLGSFMLPLICIIDPANPSVYQDRTTSTQPANEFFARLISGAGLVVVTFDTQDGGALLNDIYVKPSSAYGALPTPMRVGCAFDGWHTTANDGGSPVTAQTTVTIPTAHTLYARWTSAGGASVATFDAQGGSVSPASRTVFQGTVYGSLPVPVLIGHQFGGWYTAPNGGGNEVLGSTLVSTTADHALYAKWTSTPIQIDSTGDFFSNEGSTKTVSVVAFGAWSVSKPVEATWVAYATGSGDGSTSFQFTVEPNTTGVYRAATLAFTDGVVTRNYEIMQNSQSWKTSKSAAMSEAAASGKKVLLMVGYFANNYTRGMRTVVCESGQVKKALKAGYVLWFSDWNTSINEFWDYYSGLGGISLPMICIIDPTTPHTYQDRTTGTHSESLFLARLISGAGLVVVTFDTQGGALLDTVYAKPGSAYGALPTPMRAGCIFDSWHTTAGDGGSPVTAQTTVTISSDHTLYARWTPTGVASTVTFDAQGGNVSPATKTVYEGASYNALPIPTKSGGLFAGWYADINGGGDKVFATTLATTTSNHTLYAKWTPIATTATIYYADASRADDSGDGQTPATAKKILQSAIDLAVAGNVVLVSDGVYTPISTTNNAIIIQSINGAQHTIIDGAGSQRCATLGGASTDTATVLTGFTLRNGQLPSPSNSGGGSAYGTINECVFTNNYAYYGGGSYYGVLNRCKFIENTAWSYGGGSYYGTISDSLYIRNNGINGGGSMYADLNNCTVKDNTVSYNAGAGGVYFGIIQNCVIWGNTAGGVLNNYIGATISYSCTTPQPSGAGNIDLDPLFSDAEGRLSLSSPCFNAGNNAAAVGAFDLDGNARIHNTTADMGAYEIISLVSVTFDTQNGSVALETRYVIIGAQYGALPTPARTGYTFNGWHTSVSNGSPVTATSVATSISHTVYAQWTPIGAAYTATFDAQGGCVSPATKIVYEGAAYDALPIPTKSGSIFSGWHTKMNGGEKILATTLVTATTNHTLYAKWTTLAQNAVVYYVDASRVDDSDNGLTPATAKKILQSAVDLAFDGDVVLVFNGVYAPVSTANKAITIQSLNGAERTIIDGANNQRCAALGSVSTDTATVLTGFTLRRGSAVYEFGGGTFGGTINKCVFADNEAMNGGGSAYGVLNKCVFIDNEAIYGGGGSYYGTINNSVYLRNKALIGGGAYFSTLYNCTVKDNTASYDASAGGGTRNGIARNCVLWGNMAAGETNDYASTSLSYTCAFSTPSSGGNINIDPMFTDAEGRLALNSPCKNKGYNYYSVGDFDLDGNARIQDTTVDMGAYEIAVPTHTSVPDTPVPVEYAWINQYYPTSPTHEYINIVTNSGANGLFVWQSYVACLNPTNPASRFTAGITFTNGVPEITCDPYRPDIRDYEVIGRDTLDNSNSWGVTNCASRFFKVKVLLK